MDEEVRYRRLVELNVAEQWYAVCCVRDKPFFCVVLSYFVCFTIGNF